MFWQHLLPVVALVCFSWSALAQADTVVADGDVEISREEFEAALSLSPQKLQSLAAHDLGDRFELINSMVQVRKLAAEAEKLSSDEPGYWALQFQILAIKRQFMFDRALAAFEVPDVKSLAREYYDTQRDKYATKPETRASSHLLLASPPGLDRTEVRIRAQNLLNQLRDGADFEEMVAEYSDDPGSKQRRGSLDRWIRFGEPSITPPYSEALFEIDEIGGYSEVTDSQFGVHIIRLDGIREGGYYPFEDVRDAIVKDIIAEYKALAANEIAVRYGISDDAFIDGEAMEELFAPYK
jgi:parvulin-like peptidyl-prolyl isomerase